MVKVDGERHRFYLRLFEIVTDMAQRFWSSKWRKLERYGGASFEYEIGQNFDAARLPQGCCFGGRPLGQEFPRSWHTNGATTISLCIADQTSPCRRGDAGRLAT